MNPKYSKQKQLLILFFLFFISVNSFSQCWSKIASSPFHSIAIANNGTLWAWGSNSHGQLGTGTSNDSNIPVQVGTANNWVSIAVGSNYTVALRSTGVLGYSNTLWAWGINTYGQLGDGTLINKNVPIQIGTNTKWTQISASPQHVMAINDTNPLLITGSKTLWGWGENSLGQLGNGITPDQTTPIQIGTAIDWGQVSAGGFYSVAQKVDGRLFAWGSNFYGQLGINSTANTTIRTQIGTDADWSSNFVAGSGFTLAIKNNGTLWAWGENSLGQLGNGSTTDSLLPIQIGTNNDWAKVDSGNAHSIALKTIDGAVYTWGNNSVGQLGIGTNNVSISRNLIAYNTTAISAGGNVGYLLKSEGILQSWGNNYSGQLGIGTFSNLNIPTPITCPTSLGIKNQAEVLKVVLFPNPSTNGSFTIQSITSVQNVTVFDILGKQIDIEKNNDSCKVNASAGIYTIKISDHNGNSQIKKLIMQ